MAKATESEKKESLILSAEEFVELALRPNLTTGRRFCFILGAGASVESGIPAGTKLERLWMDWLLDGAEDPLADENETPRRTREKLEEDAEKQIGKLRFAQIKEEWQAVRDKKKKSMSSEYYFDIYTLRFPQKKYAYRYLERLMEPAYPSMGYHTLALLLTKNSQHNLVITTNFDRLVESALSIYTEKIPQVLAHESMALFLDAELERPLIAKVHRDLLFNPSNDQQSTKESIQAWKEPLKKALEHYTPIVIGYGGGDSSLMDFLLEEKDHLKGLYWCYYEPDELPKEEKILNLVCEAGGYFVPIKGFNDLMLKMGEALYQNKVLPGNTEAFLNWQTKTRIRLYNEQFQELRSDNPEIFERLDDAQQAEEEQREAEGKLTAWDYFRRGNRAADEGDFPKAIEAYSKAIELDPDYAEVYIGRGNVYFQTDKNNEALADYSKAIELDPDDAWGYLFRGLTYAMDGKLNEAIADYDRAIELKPDFAAAYYNRGNAYTELKQYDEAIADYNKAIELKPDYAMAYKNRGAAYGKDGKPNEAIADFSKAIELDRKMYQPYYGRAESYHLEQWDKAIADYNKAIELDPDDAAAYNNRGNAYKKQGKDDEAIADYSKAIELKPDYAAAYYNRGLAYYKLEQWDKAIADFYEVIEIQPDNADAYNNCGHLHNKLGQHQEAIENCSKAIELGFTKAWPYANRGEAYCKLKDYKAAIRDCSKAIELGSDDLDALITAHTYRAKAYRAKAYRAKAYRAFGKFDLAMADEKRARILRNQKNKK